MEKFLLIIGLLNLLILLGLNIKNRSFLKVNKIVLILILSIILIINIISWILFFIATELLIITFTIIFMNILIMPLSITKNTLESKYERDRNDFN